MIQKKQILIIVIGCLFFGAVFGWVIRGGDNHEEHTHVAEDGTVYTCSMHPQIRQNEPGQCPICGMALTPVKQGNGDSDPFILEMTAEAMALSNVMTTTVNVGQATGETRLTGTIQQDEQRVNNLTANYSGRIDHLFVSFTGQEVKRGQKLATVYSPELVNAQKELLETMKIINNNPALYEAAKEKLRLWNISDAQIQEIEASGEVKTQFDIIAEASGVVTARNVAVGDFVNRGTSLFEVVDLSRVWVILDAYENDLGSIRKGDKVTFAVNAIPGREFSATVIFIDPILNPDTRTLAVRAEASNPGQQLKPGMFVSGLVNTGSTLAEQGLMVPKSAILWTGKRSVVYVQKGTKAAPAFEMREVNLGPRAGDQYIIQAGLESGEEVVTNGVFAIDGAAQLSGNYSMMGRPEIKTMDVHDDFRRQLSSVIQSYLSLKDALVKTDVKASQAAVPATKTALQKVDMGLLESKAHDIWMGLLNPIQSSLDRIQQATDVEEQRKHFEILSDNLIEAVEYFGVVDNTFYRQYCPMAFQDQGAYWLSAEKEIRNPYFGDKMLTCGEVTEDYHPGEKITANEKKSASLPVHNH